MAKRLALLFLVACGDCSYETRVSTEARLLAAVQAEAMTVGFSAEVVNDHLGLAPTGPGGGRITGLQFPEDQWWPRVRVDVVGPLGEVDVQEDRARHWYQVGPPLNTEAQAQALADTVTLETCVGPNVVIYRYQYGSTVMPWAAVYSRGRYAQHADAPGASETTCEAALLLQPTLADALLAAAAIPFSPNGTGCDALVFADLPQDAMRCALTASDVDADLTAQMRSALPTDPTLQAALLNCLMSSDTRTCGPYADQLVAIEQRETVVRHHLGTFTRIGLATIDGSVLARTILSLDDTALCVEALEVAAAAAHSAPARVARLRVHRAGDLALGLNQCAPQKVESIVASMIPTSNEPWPADQSESSDCPDLRDEGTCLSLIRRAGIVAARTCQSEHVAASRAHLSRSGIIFRTGDTFARESDQDAALRVMSACSPAEATALLHGVPRALPSSYGL